MTHDPSVEHDKTRREEELIAHHLKDMAKVMIENNETPM